MSGGLKAALAAGVVVALAGIGFEALSGEDTVVVREDWPDGGKPQAVDCYKFTGLTTDTKEYLSVVECAAAGTKPVPASLDVVEVEVVAAQDAKREVYEPGEIGGFECACSTGRDCEEFLPPPPERGALGAWGQGRPGVKYGKGNWRGVGCFRIACNEFSRRDVSSWSDECPTE